MSKRRHIKRRDSSISSNHKKTLIPTVIWCASAIIAILIALLVGNVLKKSSEKLNGSGYQPAFSYTNSNLSIPSVAANYIDVSHYTSDSLLQLIESLSADVTSVSLYLREGNCAPLYFSEVSKSVMSSTGSIDLGLAVEKLHEKNIYVSACIDCNSFYASNDISRNAAISFEASMIAEISSAGVDDVIIINAPVSDQEMSYTSKLCSEAKKIYPDATIGVAIKYADVVSSSGADAIKKYSEIADFCAIDTANDPSFSLNSISSTDSIVYLFQAYPLRMLIATSGEIDFNSQKDALNSLGITNIQAYTKKAPVALG